MKKLTAKQQRFVDEYLIDLNGAQAAIRAGYSKKTAKEIASETLTKPNVAAAIADRTTKRAERVEVTQDEVIAELAKIGFANMLDYVVPSSDGNVRVNLADLDRDKAAAIQEIVVDEMFSENDGETKVKVQRVRFKLADKRAALVDLGKHLGMFVLRVEQVDRSGTANALEAGRRRVEQARKPKLVSKSA